MNETKSIREAVGNMPLFEALKKSDYQVYHDTYTSAVEGALDFAERNGYEYDKEETATTIGTGPAKPSEGKTNKFTITLYKGEKEQRKGLQFQVYNRGTNRNTYELNAYIS